MKEEDAERAHDYPVVGDGVPALDPCISNLGTESFVVFIALRQSARDSGCALEQLEGCGWSEAGVS